MAFALALMLLAADVFLFTSFRGNGESGLFLAISTDGLKWEALNGDKSWLPCEHEGQLMRDPFLARGPDGTYHLIWTWSWRRDQMKGRLQMGHASSKDLLTWSPQEAIPVFDDEPNAMNAWAPEMVWDAKAKYWIIFWATTIRGKFDETAATGDSGYNHRIYSMTTRDFKSFTKPRLYYDPGFNSIDSSLFRDGSRWVMVFKDERKEPLQKRLRLAFADSPAGPWSAPTEPISGDWVEGPSALKIGDWWYIYFDHYSRPQYYGAIRSRDLKQWEDVTSQVSFPPGQRHGTALRIDEAVAKRLKEARR